MSGYDERDVELLKIAYAAALDSPDLSTQLGAFLPILDGHDRDVIDAVMACNTMPSGIAATEERLSTRPAKYVFTEHAERGAIYKAAKLGIPTEGLTLYCPWFACDSCARAIICAGITRVVGHKRMCDATPERWVESVADGDLMFAEAGIETVYVEEKLDVAPIRFNGELWYP